MSGSMGWRAKTMWPGLQWGRPVHLYPREVYAVWAALRWFSLLAGTSKVEDGMWLMRVAHPLKEDDWLIDRSVRRYAADKAKGDA